MITKGFDIMHTSYLIPHRVDGLWGFKDIYGKLVIEPAWEMAEPFTGSFAKVFDGNCFGLIDTSGVVILDPKYDKIVLRDDLSGYEFHLNGKIGFISFDRRFFLMPQLSYLGPLAEGFIPAAKDGLYGFLNGRFETAHTFMYSLTEPFRHGIARVTTTDGKTFLIDRKGRPVENIRYIYPTQEGFGNFLSSPEMHKLEFSQKLPNGVYVYSRRFEAGFTAMTSRQEYMMAAYYDSISYLSPSFVKVGLIIDSSAGFRDSYHYGVFDLKGNQILPPVFECVKYLDSNCFLVRLRGKWGIINNRLEVLDEPVLERVPKTTESLVELTNTSGFLISDGYLEDPENRESTKDISQQGANYFNIDGIDAYIVQKDDNYWSMTARKSDRRNIYWICSDSDDKDTPQKYNSFIDRPDYTKTISHGTIPVDDLLENDEKNDEKEPVLDGNFNYIDPEYRKKTGEFSLDSLNDPESWIRSLTLQNEDDELSDTFPGGQYDWIIQKGEDAKEPSSQDHADFLSDLLADDEPLDFGFPGNDDDDDDDDYDASLSPEEEAEFLKSLEKSNADPEDKKEEMHLHFFNGETLVLENGSKPVFVPNKPVMVYWGEGAYLLSENGPNFEASTILNARFEPLDPEIHPCVNDRCKVEGYRRVVCRGRFGFIDKNGDLAVEPAFISLSQFMKKKALGITATSTIIMNTELEYKELPLKLLNFHSWDGTMASGCISTPEGGKWGVFDENGNILIPFEYEFIRHIGEMSFIVKINGKFGVINAKREMLVEPVYTAYKMTETSLITLRHTGGWYHLFNVRTQRLITSYECQGGQKPLRPTRVSDLGDGLLYLETVTTTGYLDLSSPVNTRLITE